MRHRYLYFLIAMSGASVLAVEILGSRILGPFYGVSLFLWSALITVTLAALSAGYALGGRWADRGATYPRLSSLICGAGVWLILVPWMRHPLLRLAEPFGLRFAVLLAATGLFLVPLLLLGMVSPYAIKLKTSRLEEIGRSAGNLYAISTLASVAAALLTGFFLIPSFGIYRLTISVGVILIAAALPGFFIKRGAGVRLALPVLVLIAGAALALSRHENRPDLSRGLLFKAQSPYGEIRVVEDGADRYLLIDGGIHTAIDTLYRETLLPYVDVIDMAKNFFREPGRVLIIGLGGGSIAESYHRAGWKVDAVELDPLVIMVAFRYFGMDSADARVFRMDGRRFLTISQSTYDVIVLDAFGSSSIPFHLVTSEMFSLAAAHLAPDGILAANVQAVGWHDSIVRSVAATLETQFPHVLALPTMEPPNALGNVILFASKRALELPEELPVPTDRFTPEYARAHAWDNRFEPDTRGAPILTDDRNRIDLWAEAVNMRERRELHERFAGLGLDW
jgi:spermidine synthase